MAKKVKIKPRSISRKKDLKKERKRYELRRKGKKLVKKQINSLFPENKAISEQNSLPFEERKKLLSLLYKTLDSHQNKGLVTRGRANRLKSRYTRKLNSLSSTPEESTTDKA